MIIDAHLHLWNKQHGMVNGKPVFDIGGGKSDFGGVIRQMMPENGRFLCRFACLCAKGLCAVWRS